MAIISWFKKIRFPDFYLPTPTSKVTHVADELR